MHFIFSTFTDSPSIYIKVVLMPFFYLNFISKGPPPWQILTPVRVTLYNAKVNQLLKDINSNFPSSKCCGYLLFSMPILLLVDFLVIQTFLSPHIQLVQFRHTKPLYPLLSQNYPLAIYLVIFSSLYNFLGYLPVNQSYFASFETIFESEQLISSQLGNYSQGTTLKYSMVSATLSMDSNNFLAPTRVYKSLFMKAFDPRFFSTLQTIRASSPMPKQLVKHFLRTLYGLLTYCQSFISQNAPPLYIASTQMSHISQYPTYALFHWLTIEWREEKSFRSKFIALKPHPTEREKSLPVPIGWIPIVIFSKFILFSSALPRTHGMVPSPPQIIILTSAFQFYCQVSFRASQKPNLALGASNKSNNSTVTNNPVAKTQLSFLEAS